MTTDDRDTGDEPFDRERFRIELAALVDRAHDAGVAIGGAYDVRTPRPEAADYTVEISRVARPSFRSDSGSLPMD